VFVPEQQKLYVICDCAQHTLPIFKIVKEICENDSYSVFTYSVARHVQTEERLSLAGDMFAS